MLLGIFVGGRSRRMGGKPKGLLRAPDGTATLLERLARVGGEAGLTPVLVGAAELGPLGARWPRLLDRGPPVGPLSGLLALLHHAGDLPAVAIGCDMPRVSAALLRRVAREQPHADVLAPRDAETGKWHPLCTRYASARVLSSIERAVEGGARSFQAVFRQLSVAELPISEAERPELADWDSPEDIV